MKSLLKSVLKTVVYILDQADQAASEVRERVSDQVEDVSDRVSDLRDRVYGRDNTWRNVAMFAAGVGVGIGAGMLLAPASGEEIRGTVRDRVQDIGDRVRDRFSSTPKSTGTEGM